MQTKPNPRQSLSHLLCLMAMAGILASSASVASAQEYQTDRGRRENPDKVAQVMAGTIKTAYAAWWGFDEDDATASLQAAIDSGAEKVIVSNMGRDWVITPITLASNQEIFLEPGVVVTAKKGAFHETHDSLFRAAEGKNITIGGYGATLRMQKQDYMSEAYKKAEWRSGIYLDSCSDVLIYGLTIRDTGGDGVYLGHGGEAYVNTNVTIKDVVFDNNYRQGISVVSAENLLIENCLFKNTSGTGPAAGIDLEPDNPPDRLINVVIRNCVAENNQGAGFIVSVSKLTSESKDISILFENCYVKSSAHMDNEHPRGIEVCGPKDDGPRGTIEFRNCHVENTQTHGIRIFDRSASNGRLRFVNCTLKNVANGSLPDWYPAGLVNVPIVIWSRGHWDKKPGGVEFVDCVIQDDQDRPFLTYATTYENPPAIHDVSGNITVINPHGAVMDLGADPVDMRLRVKP